jgi:peroxiredoxin
MHQAVAWHNKVEKFKALGFKIATVTYDDVRTLKRFRRRSAPGLTMIADDKSRIIRKFGLLNESYSRGSYSYGVAHPIIIVLDPSGRVTHRFSNSGYMRRPSVNLVLKTLRGRGKG